MWDVFPKTNKDMCWYVHLRALFEDKTQILELCTTAAGKEGRHGPAEAGVWPLLSWLDVKDLISWQLELEQVESWVQVISDHLWLYTIR